MRRRSLAFWISLTAHVGLGVLVAMLASEEGRAAGAGRRTSPRAIHLTGKSGPPGPGKDMLFEVLKADGMPIHLASTTGDEAVGLAWWAPSVGMWLALDRLPPGLSGRTLDVSLKVGDAGRESLGSIELDDDGSGRIVVVWSTDRPAPGTPITLTVSVPGSLWQLRASSPALVGSAPMRK